MSDDKQQAQQRYEIAREFWSETLDALFEVGTYDDAALMVLNRWRKKAEATDGE